jgi:hypothetical protein
MSLGMEAFEVSKDKSLLGDMKDSISKANIILKFFRELYSSKSSTYCYSLSALSQLVAGFLKKQRIQFELESDFDSIPSIAGRIVMYNAIMNKEIIPFGGVVSTRIYDNSCEIVTICTGDGIIVPAFDVNEEPNHKNVLRYCLLRLLEESGFNITAHQEDRRIVIREWMR